MHFHGLSLSLPGKLGPQLPLNQTQNLGSLPPEQSGSDFELRSDPGPAATDGGRYPGQLDGPWDRFNFSSPRRTTCRL